MTNPFDQFTPPPAVVDETYHRARRREAIAELLQPWREQLRCPGMRYADLRNEAFCRRVKPPALLAAVKAWVPGDTNLVLCGPTGSGKTSVLVARLRAALRRHARACERAPLAGDLPPIPRLCRTTEPALVAARRQHPLGQGEAPLVEKAQRFEVLVVDEAGYERDGPQLLQEVVNARYEAGLATAMASGRRPAELASHCGDALWRRLAEVEGAVVVDGWPK